MLLMIFAALALATGPTLQGFPPSPVSVSQPTVGALTDGAPVIEFSVTNGAKQTVTAWEVRVELTLSDGTSGGLSLAREGYASFEGVVTDRGQEPPFIRPGASIVGTIPVPDMRGLSFAVRGGNVVWAIFEDGSWVGDPERVQANFKRRQDERRAMQEIVGALRTGISTGPDGVAVALTLLTPKDSATEDNHAKRLMRENLKRLARKQTNSAFPVNVLPYLQQLLASYEAPLAAAEKHSQPKAGGPPR
jgi:hypothetical protein